MSGLRSRRRTRGVSLIEAVVALAIVGIGMVGLVGIQASLRMNSDVAKQRSEAVRLAQDAVEEWRGFPSVTASAGFDYTDIGSDSPEEVEASAVTVGSATYKTARTVTDMTGPLRGKALAVKVEWRDRNDDLQSVQLSTMIAGVAPELGGTLALPPTGIPARNPRGRSFVVPPGAKMLDDGTSALRLPGDAGVAWRFDNLSGLITLCTTTAATTLEITKESLTCGGGTALLLSGYIRYATDVAGQPTAAHALDPPGANEALTLVVERALPLPTATIDCYQVPGDVVTYFCAVPLVFPALSWSGSLVFGPTPPVAAATTATASAERRICKYPQNVNLVNIRAGLANQNYLVINAGDGATTSFHCPAGTTAHQPV